MTFEVASTFIPEAGVAGKVLTAARVGDAAVDVVRVGEKVTDGVRIGDRIADGARVFSVLARQTADRLGISPARVQEILDTPTALRPDPSTYLPSARFTEHASAFEAGASRFTLKSALDKYGLAQRDGTTFVVSRSEADRMLATAGGDPRKLEQMLGLPKGQLDSAELVRIDFSQQAMTD